MLVVSWLSPVLIVLSVLLLGRSFYILYVQRRGTWAALRCQTGRVRGNRTGGAVNPNRRQSASDCPE